MEIKYINIKEINIHLNESMKHPRFSFDLKGSFFNKEIYLRGYKQNQQPLVITTILMILLELQNKIMAVKTDKSDKIERKK